ncbi:hypothetical protein ACOME3_005262 [Neoechinorhynchus agilis]
MTDSLSSAGHSDENARFSMDSLDSVNLRMFHNLSQVVVPMNVSEFFSLRFPFKVYELIIKDSLQIEKVPVLSVTFRKLEPNGIKVKIRGSDGRLRESVIIDYSRGLIKEISSGHYAFVARDSMIFERMPLKEQMEAIVRLERAGYIRLKYLLQKLYWYPRCEIDLNNTDGSCGGRYRFWANVRNDGVCAIKVNRLQLCINDVENGATFIEWGKPFLFNPETTFRIPIDKIKVKW